MGYEKDRALEKRTKAGNSAKKWLKSSSQYADTAPRRSFEFSEREITALAALLNAASEASGMVSVGFNRSGSVHVTAFLEGERETVTAITQEEFLTVCNDFEESFGDYATAKGWRRPSTRPE